MISSGSYSGKPGAEKSIPFSAGRKTPGECVNKGEGITNLIKVDIKSGRVRENNLADYRARQARQGYRKIRRENPLARYPANNSLHRPLQLCDPAGPDYSLLARVRQFRLGVKVRTNSWSESELYRLAVLMGKEKLSSRRAGQHLARSGEACKYMFRQLKRAGVTKGL